MQNAKSKLKKKTSAKRETNRMFLVKVLPNKTF